MATIRVKGNLTQPKAVHAGTNTALFRLSTSVTLSAGDKYLIGKLPHRAVPIEAVWYPGAAQPAGFVAKFGTSASEELFLGSATYSVATRSTRNMGPRFRVSLSDEQTIRFENVVAVPTAGVTVGHIGDLVVQYVLDDQL
jgi:hypothetical protein